MDSVQKVTQGIVVSSRIRLARDIKNIPFPYRAEGLEASAKIIDKTYNVLSRLGNFELYKIGTIGETKANALREQHLISTDLIRNKSCGCAIISADKQFSIMVNEEDHLREQCMLGGLKLSEAYAKIYKIDSELSKHFDFAYDRQFGYLTACLTNIGTGMRASAMLFLPSLTQTNNIKGVINQLSNAGFEVRGVYGEGSDAVGCLYQISNKSTLGSTEEGIIENVNSVVVGVCKNELIAREQLYKSDEIALKDKVMRAVGTLTNAHILDCNEFMGLISFVKLGVLLGILRCSDDAALDTVVLNCQPFNIIENAHRQLTSRERDIYRADYVRGVLKKVITK